MADMIESGNAGITTPAFVFDTAKLSERVDYIKRTLGKRFRLCYAIKANPFLIGELIGAIDGLEVCSPGEYRICERVGIAPEKIVLSGVYKEREDIRRIVKACGAKTVYTAESPSQAELLSELGKERGITLPVILRLSSGNQFGMDGATLKSVLSSGLTNIDVIGVQLYSGTQKRTDKIEREIKELIAFVAELEKDCGLNCRRIEYGPGLGVTYFKNEPERDDAAAMQVVADAFGSVPERIEIVLEMGRFIAAYCGEYRTQIVDKKTTAGVNYLITDGGINHLNYYGQVMAMKQPFMRVERREDGALKEAAAVGDGTYTVCGALCTTADVLVKSCPMGLVEVGDTLVFSRVGAYSVTEGIYLFLSRDMPRIYKRDGKGALTLLRDTVETDTFNGRH